MTTMPNKAQSGYVGSNESHPINRASMVAGVLLVVSGSFSILMGASGIATDNLFAASDYIYGFNLTTWGVIHLIVGVALFVVGLGVLTGQSWVRGAGVMVAGVSLITQFMFIPYYPAWSIAVMVLDLVIVFALTRSFQADV